MPNPDFTTASSEDLIAALEARADRGEVPADLYERLVTLVARTRPQAREALAANPAEGARAPALALLSADARRCGEAAEIFGERFFGPKANGLTYRIPIPDQQLPMIALPSLVLEACKNAGGWLRFHVNQTPDGKPLNMLAMDQLVAGRWATMGKGKLLFDKGGWKAAERFYTHGTPRLGWRVVFPDVLAGTTNEDDLKQTELLIAEVTRLFGSTALSENLENAFREFEAKKAATRAKMEGDEWPQASEDIEGFAVSGLIRPVPSELTDIQI